MKLIKKSAASLIFLISLQSCAMQQRPTYASIARKSLEQNNTQQVHTMPAAATSSAVAQPSDAEKLKVLEAKIDALNDEYCDRSTWFGCGQGMTFAPGSPIHYLHSVRFQLGEKSINSLCLFVASKDSCHELFQILLDAGADVNYQEKDRYGKDCSLLGQACRARAAEGQERPEFKNAKLLLSRGAQAKIPYKFSNRDWQPKPHAVVLLLAHGAKLQEVWEPDYHGGLP
jgi:hypothetical protein